MADWQIKRSKKVLKSAIKALSEPEVKSKKKQKTKIPEKIYFYLKWDYTGYNVTGIHKVEDTDFDKLKRRWLKESKWNITPIMEGFNIKRKDDYNEDDDYDE